MHPNNPYAIRRPNFHSLAQLCPSLKSFLTTNQNDNELSIDLKNPEAVRQLTYALLLKDFDLKLELPSDRLCPIVPGRLDYCLWVIDILKSNPEFDRLGGDILIIDIGTGSSAIYPLLFSRLLPKAKSLATEIDSLSLNSAINNVTLNSLSDTITIHKPVHSNQQAILPIERIVADAKRFKYIITLCNPPFYCSQLEIENLSSSREDLPIGICTGSEVEMICEGGEERFIEVMMKDSLTVGNQIRWFTSLCGKYTTLSFVINLYKSLGGNNFAISEFNPGRTKRWAIAWSWQHYRLSDNISRALGAPSPRLKDSKRLLPLPNLLEYFFPLASFGLFSKKILSDRITKTLQEIESCTLSESCSDYWKIGVMEKTWSRSARRKRKFGAANQSQIDSIGQSNLLAGCENQKAEAQSILAHPILKVKVLLKTYQANPPTQSSQAASAGHSQNLAASSDNHTKHDISCNCGLKLEIEWEYGLRRDDFESFWNHLLKRLRNS
ncbi:hypothetical protein O181_064895 [Austropuccinia psidii MF-1]|uniref:U6 small nuclear RNA (adenine-(43)-N(6))-methyltransferase n=1 Tax=Austropuccinia psidii MF-1 TaxID=1389203 RepID=A0A9Q3ELC5_9BASI|nr:hypothetical protein [Austropuccinia psidii MF-1]